MDLKEQAQLGGAVDRHWYYRAKSAAVMRMLRAVRVDQVLDVGAGSGYFSKQLLKNGYAQTAWCVDPNYENEHDEDWYGAAVHFRRHHIGSEAGLVLMMDVLEHVEDDLGLLREYVTAMKSGAYFLITVPAFQWLWSGHDVFLEHYRRYTLKQLEERLREAGLEICRGSYFFGLLFPLAAAVRLPEKLRIVNRQQPQSNLKIHYPLVNGLLFNVCRLELPIFKWNRLAGLSAVCLARKA